MTSLVDGVRGGGTPASALLRLAASLAVGAFALAFDGDGTHVSDLTRAGALVVAAALAVGGIAQLLTAGRRPFVLPFLLLDTAAPIALLWLYRADSQRYVFVLLVTAVLQGAAAYRTRGAVIAWAVSSGAYVALEVAARPLTGTPADPAVVALRVAVLLGVALLAGRLADELFDGLRSRGKAEEELRRTLDHLRRTDRERRRLVKRLVVAQEQERRRISDDIHDDTIQTMTAVAIRLQMLRRHAGGEDDVKVLEDIERNVHRSIARLRSLLFDVRPPALDREGLGAAVRMALARLGETAGVSVVVDDCLTEEPPAATRTIAFRIVQEALANVRKHADASRVDALLEPRDGGLFVRIRDDGRGFRSGDGAPNGHFGITAMRERAEMAGGRFRVWSSPGAGTLVEFWVPYDPTDPDLRVIAADGDLAIR